MKKLVVKSRQITVYDVVDENTGENIRNDDGWGKVFYSQEDADFAVRYYNSSQTCPKCNNGKLLGKMRGGVQCDNCTHGEPCF